VLFVIYKHFLSDNRFKSKYCTIFFKCGKWRPYQLAQPAQKITLSIPLKELTIQLLIKSYLLSNSKLTQNLKLIRFYCTFVQWQNVVFLGENPISHKRHHQSLTLWLIQSRMNWSQCWKVRRELQKFNTAKGLWSPERKWMRRKQTRSSKRGRGSEIGFRLCVCLHFVEADIVPQSGIMQWLLCGIFLSFLLL